MSSDVASVVETAEKFAARHIPAPVVADVDHGPPAFPSEVFGHGRAAGLDRCVLPEAVGGMGFGEVELCALVETLARACAGHALVFGVQAAASAALQRAGALDDPAGAARSVLDAGAPIAVAVPEPGAEAGELDLTLRAAPDTGTGELLLDGDAGLAINAADTGALLCFARSTTEEPLALLLGDAAHESAALFGGPEAALGLRALPLARPRLTGRPVPRSGVVVAGEAARALYRSLLGELGVVTAAAALGVMGAARAAAVGYAAERYQSGKMIIDHSHMRSILGAMSAAHLAAEGAVRHAAAGPERLDLALATKVSVTQSAVACCTDAVQVLGGYGYMRDYGLEKRLRDAAVLSLLPISNDRAELLLAARAKQAVA